MSASVELLIINWAEVALLSMPSFAAVVAFDLEGCTNSSFLGEVAFSVSPSSSSWCLRGGEHAIRHGVD